MDFFLSDIFIFYFSLELFVGLLDGLIFLVEVWVVMRLVFGEVGKDIVGIFELG